MDDTLRCLDQLNPDAISRLVAAGENDWTNAVAKRREAAGLADTIANGFAKAVENLSQQQLLSRSLIDDGTSGRMFIQTASKETQSKFLVVLTK
ncbi:hypothetical protein R1T40_04770 [Tritonibacter scottomollicae]|uniref:Uncharacterized protein n=2 Tax=Tritonibacter scottomollicae TaxID=483013 RepID=A0ABZ0HIQ5_TRISK|nr:hypothetical protein R1T40_04770 [Tritonibacter scottomollicae]